MKKPSEYSKSNMN